MPRSSTLKSRGLTYYKLHTDGGIIPEEAKPSGEASVGVVLLAPDETLVHEISARIGWVQDHHVAEYCALAAGLRLALGHGVDRLRVYIDSGVVAGQVNGKSSVKPDLLRYLRQALDLKEQFSDIQITQVPRAKNKEAHKLADKALGR